MSSIEDLKLLSKTNWFTGKLVGLSDIERDREYFENFISILTKGGTGQGILYGLNVETNPSRTANDRPWTIKLSAGVCIFPNGTIGIVESQDDPLIVDTTVEEPVGFFNQNPGKNLGLYLIKDNDEEKGAVPIINAGGSCQDNCETLLFKEKPKLIFDFLPDEHILPSSQDGPVDTFPEQISDNGKDFVNKYYDEHLTKTYVGSNRKNRILLAVYKDIVGNRLEINLDATKNKRKIVFNNELLFHLINAHLAKQGNPHDTLPNQLGNSGAIVSVNDVVGWDDASHNGNVFLDSDSFHMRTFQKDLDRNEIGIEPLFKIKTGVVTFKLQNRLQQHQSKIFGPIPLDFSNHRDLPLPNTIPYITLGNYMELDKKITSFENINAEPTAPSKKIVSVVNIQHDQFFIKVYALDPIPQNTEFTYHYHAMFGLPASRNTLSITEYLPALDLQTMYNSFSNSNGMASLKFLINENVNSQTRTVRISLPQTYSGVIQQQIRRIASRKYMYDGNLEMYVSQNNVPATNVQPTNHTIQCRPGEIGTITYAHSDGTDKIAKFKAAPTIYIKNYVASSKVLRDHDDKITFHIRDASRKIRTSLAYTSKISLNIGGKEKIVKLEQNNSNDAEFDIEVTVSDILNVWPSGSIHGKEMSISGYSYYYKYPKPTSQVANTFEEADIHISTSSQPYTTNIPFFKINNIQDNENTAKPDSDIIPISSNMTPEFALRDDKLPQGDKIRVQVAISTRIGPGGSGEFGPPILQEYVPLGNISARGVSTLRYAGSGTRMSFSDLIKLAVSSPLKGGKYWVSFIYKGTETPQEDLNYETSHFYVEY